MHDTEGVKITFFFLKEKRSGGFLGAGYNPFVEKKCAVARFFGGVTKNPTFVQ